MNPPSVRPWAPGLGWWLLLATVIAVGILGNWLFAAALLVLVLAQLARPLDFLTAYLIVVGGAAFIANAAGGLTLQLGLLTSAIVLMIICYVLTKPARALSVARTPLTWPLVTFLALTLANTARGLLVGHPLRSIGLELIALLALGSALLVANVFEPRRDLRWAVIGLVLIGAAATTRGFQVFAITRAHTGLGYTMAVPGLVGLLLVNLALRSKSGTAAAGLTLLALPMFLQQFITFGRGLWSGCLAGLVASAVLYAGYGRGTGARWKRTSLVYAGLAGSGVLGALVVALAFEQTGLLREAWTRVLSSFSTEVTYESRSNLIRLGEYAFVWKLIQASPWFGYGVGYTFLMKQVLSLEVGEQWYAHQYFLFVWLKQGLIGLVVFVWMILAAAALGAREARRRQDPLEATWFSTLAAATVFLAVFSLSNFPFGVVNEMFLLALLWGGGMAMTRTGSVTLRWSAGGPNSPKRSEGGPLAPSADG